MAKNYFTNDILEGNYKGIPFKYRFVDDVSQGCSSLYGPAYDEINRKKVFLKQYKTPGPKAKWFQQFINYMNLFYEKYISSNEAQQTIARMKFFQDKNNFFWQEIEYIESSKDLSKYLESFETTWEQRKTFSTVFMYAMSLLHRDLRVVHGDLKPENLLLTPFDDGKDYQIKLIDFDRPILLEQDEIPWLSYRAEGFVGTCGYYSPEHAQSLRPIDKSDIFTCGLILYELLSKPEHLSKSGHPYLEAFKLDINDDNDRSTLINLYKDYKAPLPQFYGTFGSVDKDAKVAEMLHRMLDPDPAKRPTAEEVHTCLISRPKGQRVPPPPQRPIPPSEKISPQASMKNAAADIVFLLDATSSMGNCINALKRELHTFIHNMLVGDEENGILPVKDWRARVVGYRDFLECNSSKKTAKTYITWGNGGWFLSNPFTRDENELYAQLDGLKTFGGGSNPDESLLDALMLVMKSGYLPRNVSDFSDDSQSFAWRLNRVGKVIIVFTDAGFHDEMNYCNSTSLFEDEKEKYPFDLRGATMEDIENQIESTHCKLFIFAPPLESYQELSALSSVAVWSNVEERGGDGLVNTVQDKKKFDKLLQSIVRGVSASASAELNIVHSL